MVHAIRVSPRAFGKRKFYRLFKEPTFSLWNIFGIGLWVFYNKETYQLWKEAKK